MAKSITGIINEASRQRSTHSGLSRILQSFFLCETPFLEEPEICGYYGADANDPCYNYFTEEGAKAYALLLNLLGQLADIDVLTADQLGDIIETLDDMVVNGGN